MNKNYFFIKLASAQIQIKNLIYYLLELFHEI